jgi:3-ketosteroid 9alpha-monooxygenase subunit A
MGVATINRGWYQVAYERDLVPGLTALTIVPPMVAWRSRKGIRLFEATCPHRGAHLGIGGVPDGDVIICPFHGRRIGLGTDCVEKYCVREYPCFVVGGMVFGCTSLDDDRGFRLMMLDVDRNHFFVAGFAAVARVPCELVIENGVDATHFHSVHSVHNQPTFEVVPSVRGEFGVVGTFHLPESTWQKGGGDAGIVPVPYHARVYSDGIILSHLGGQNPYWVITTATPRDRDECTIRLSIAIPANADGTAPDANLCEYLLRQSKSGIEKDIVIWENLNHDAPSRFAPEDVAIVEMRKHFQSTNVHAR